MPRIFTLPIWNSRPTRWLSASYPAGDDIASSLSRSQFEIVFMFESFNRLGLDQGQLSIRQGLPEGSRAQGITVAFQANPGKSLNLFNGVSRHSRAGAM